MKMIDLANSHPDVAELLQQARQENLLIRSATGDEFVLAEVDSFDREIELTRRNEELMRYLDERSREEGKYSLEDMRRELGLE